MKSYTEMIYNRDNGYYWICDYSSHSMIWRNYSPSYDPEEAWINYKKYGRVPLRDERFDGGYDMYDITGAKDFKEVQVRMLVRKLCK